MSKVVIILQVSLVFASFHYQLFLKTHNFARYDLMKILEI